MFGERTTIGMNLITSPDSDERGQRRDARHWPLTMWLGSQTEAHQRCISHTHIYKHTLSGDNASPVRVPVPLIQLHRDDCSKFFPGREHPIRRSDDHNRE